jgi:hypothetical protein
MQDDGATMKQKQNSEGLHQLIYTTLAGLSRSSMYEGQTGKEFELHHARPEFDHRQWDA